MRIEFTIKEDLNNSPITPVEETKTSSFLQLIIFVNSNTYLLINFNPSVPVWALALPELTTKTLQLPLLFFLSMHFHLGACASGSVHKHVH